MSIARNLAQLADNIDSAGILATAGGGTGTATPAIVAGTNITVSGTWPNQTINSTGTVTSVAELTLGTTGTDVSSSVATGTTTPVITLNIPTASNSARGVLSTTDWNTFNNKQPTLEFTPENTANKGAANGYVPLDATSKIAATYLPSYVDDVLEYATLTALPVTGEAGKVYITIDDNKTYRWSGTVYTIIIASPGSTDSVTEGSTNLYFTTARSRADISATQNITYDSATGIITGPVLSAYLTSEIDTLDTVTGRGASTNNAITFSGGITGNLTGNATGLSEVLSVASGGTGTATPALIAGTNINVTGTWPNQTINFSGVLSTTISTATTITPTSEAIDHYTITALATASTIAAPSGIPTEGQKLTIRIKDNGTARALTWTTSSGGYRVMGIILPTTTIATKTMYIGCIYNATDMFWDVVSVAQQA